MGNRLQAAWERLNQQNPQPSPVPAPGPETSTPATVAPPMPSMPVPPAKITPPVAQPVQPPAAAATGAPAAPEAPGFEGVPIPAPIKPQIQDTRGLETQLGAAKGIMSAAEKEMAELPGQINKAYQGQLSGLRTELEDLGGKYREALQSNLNKFEKDKLITNIARVAETLLYNVTRFSAGLQGWNTGKDYVTGLPFNPSDWHGEMQALTAELRERQAAVNSEFAEKLGIKKEALQETQKTKAQELQERLAAARARYSQGGQEARDIRGDIASATRGNIERTQRATETTTEMQQRAREFNVTEKARLEQNIRADETRRELAQIKAEAAEGKTAIAAAKEDKKVEDKIATLLGDVGNKKNKNFMDARTQLVGIMKDRGMTESEISAVIKEANNASQMLPDVGDPNEMAWAPKGVEIIRAALAKAKQRAASTPAAPAAAGLPTADSIAAELARRRGQQ